MTVLAMSSAEITRLDTLMGLNRREIRIADAVELLGFSDRSGNDLSHVVISKGR